MIVKIIKEFHDIEDFAHVFKVGDVIDFTDERAEEIIRIGLGSMIQSEEDEACSTPKKRGRKSNSIE